MSVYDFIREGRYVNTVPLSPPDLVIDEENTSVARAKQMREEHTAQRRAQRELHDAETNRLNQLFQADLEAEYGLTGHPKAARLFGLAWERGHSSGYSDVAGCYSEFAELLLP